jgi:hypothetical protein
MREPARVAIVSVDDSQRRQLRKAGASMNTELLQRLREIGKLIREQDNRCTDAPIFIVQQLKRVYGFDPEYADDDCIAWIDHANDCSVASPEEHTALEEAYQNGEYTKISENWTRTAYQDRWEFVTACFTEHAAREHIRINGHNLNGPRVYAESSFRNEEFRTVRQFLLSLEEP